MTDPMDEHIRFAESASAESVIAAPPTAAVTLRGLACNGGEEFLEFKEALSDLRSLRQENRDLNGGGPGWGARWAAAWAKADELFADEDEAAYDRHIESFYG